MDVKRGIIIVSLGPRQPLVRDLVRNLKSLTQLPIAIVTDILHGYDDMQIAEVRVETESLQWRDNPRWGVRNCNVLSASSSLTLFESSCVLNDDMRVVHPGFVDGFDLAERFGVCVPLNPRTHLHYNAQGADAGPADYLPGRDGPPHTPACNVSPLFVCRLHDNAQKLIRAYLEELQVCMRGTLAFSRASWRCGVPPVYLPEHWCVCGSSARFIRDSVKTIRGHPRSIEPIMLHWGQEEVRRVFSRKDSK
jgi:hypothetical protein